MTCEAHAGLAGRRPPEDAPGRGDKARRRARSPSGGMSAAGPGRRGPRGGNVSPTPSLGACETGTGTRARSSPRAMSPAVPEQRTPRWVNRFPHSRSGLLRAAAAMGKVGAAQRCEPRLGSMSAGIARPAGARWGNRFPYVGGGGSRQVQAGAGVSGQGASAGCQDSSAPVWGPPEGRGRTTRGAGWSVALVPRRLTRCQGITVGDTRPGRVTAAARAGGHVSPTRRAG